MHDDRLQLAIEQIKFARQYVLGLLADVDDSQWFVQPAGAATHIAWQVGHLAMAQYGLALFRMRGRREIDAELMPSAFRKKFMKGSAPDPDPAANPSPAEIRAALDRVHRQVLEELPAATAEQLAEPVDEPYSVTPTRLGALYFCAAHEMMHAGQIGLLRRLLGRAPIR